MTDKDIAEVLLTCGRYVLFVAGIAVGMEGDKCREASFPEELFDPIPEEELEYASIGGRPVKEIPIEVVRWFRGDNWNEQMLRYAANEINTAIKEQKPLYKEKETRLFSIFPEGDE